MLDWIDWGTATGHDLQATNTLVHGSNALTARRSAFSSSRRVVSPCWSVSSLPVLFAFAVSFAVEQIWSLVSVLCVVGFWS